MELDNGSVNWIVLAPIIIGGIVTILAKYTDFWKIKATARKEEKKDEIDDSTRNLEAAFRMIKETQEERVTLRAEIADAKREIVETKRECNERIKELRDEILVLRREIVALKGSRSRDHAP